MNCDYPYAIKKLLSKVFNIQFEKVIWSHFHCILYFSFSLHSLFLIFHCILYFSFSLHSLYFSFSLHSLFLIFIAFSISHFHCILYFSFSLHSLFLIFIAFSISHFHCILYFSFSLHSLFLIWVCNLLSLRGRNSVRFHCCCCSNSLLSRWPMANKT